MIWMLLLTCVWCAVLVALDVLSWHADKRARALALRKDAAGYGASWQNLWERSTQGPARIGDLVTVNEWGAVVRCDGNARPLGILVRFEERKTINLYDARFDLRCYFPQHVFKITNV